MIVVQVYATGTLQHMSKISSKGAWSPVPSSFLAYNNCFPLNTSIPPWKKIKYCKKVQMQVIWALDRVSEERNNLLQDTGLIIRSGCNGIVLACLFDRIPSWKHLCLLNNDERISSFTQVDRYPILTNVEQTRNIHWQDWKKCGPNRNTSPRLHKPGDIKSREFILANCKWNRNMSHGPLPSYLGPHIGNPGERAAVEQQN